MDVIQLYEDFNVSYMTEGHKHCREGFVNTECPFCTGNPGLHLSYNIENNYYVCWRCGWKSIENVLMKLLNVEYTQAKSIAEQYGSAFSRTPVNNTPVKVRIRPHKLPTHTGPLQTNHIRYLEQRGFDPEYLEWEWRLVGTGPVSFLDKLSYNYRIIIPFFWNGVQVSFDARDVTGKAMNKYQACPKTRELIPHKDILYGKQEYWKETGICVEGPTDVWRMGPHAFATSGIKFTEKQIRIIAKTFKRVAVMFDDSPVIENRLSISSISKNAGISMELQAKAQANLLINELRFRGVDAFRVPIKGDPGGMKQNEANYLIKQLIK
jgi:hypothetical protein